MALPLIFGCRESATNFRLMASSFDGHAASTNFENLVAASEWSIHVDSLIVKMPSFVATGSSLGESLIAFGHTVAKVRASVFRLNLPMMHPTE